MNNMTPKNIYLKVSILGYIKHYFKKLFKWLSNKTVRRKEYERILRESQWPPELVESIKGLNREPCSYNMVSYMMKKIENDVKNVQNDNLSPCSESWMQKFLKYKKERAGLLERQMVLNGYRDIYK